MSNPPSPSVSARSTTEVEIANPPFRTLTTVASPKASTAPYTLPAISSSLTSDPSQSPIQPWHNYTSSAADQPLSSPAPRGTASAADLATMEILSSAPRIAESRSAQALLSQNSLERSNISREQNVSRSRQTRRTKAHVASACVNCKKAHLSCDIQRPCTRCVATGKQDSCVDVQHKKRGRPRIREEQDVERPARLAGSTQPHVSGPVPAASFTSHRQISDSRDLRLYQERYSVASLPHIQRGPATMPATSNALSPTSPSNVLTTGRFASSEYPVILLDLDLVIIKTNSKFRELITRGNEVRGYSLESLLELNAGETVRRLRNELREERDAREPNYLPPIVTPGEHRAVEAVAEENLDRLTSEYRNRSEMLNFRLSSGKFQTIPTRIRLARTSVFFVALAMYPSNGELHSSLWQQPRHTQVSGLAENRTDTYSGSQQPSRAYTSSSPFQSFQSLSTSLPPITTTTTSSSFALSPTSRYEYPRSHSSTPLTSLPPSAGLMPRPDSEYGVRSVRYDTAIQRAATPTYQQPQLPPIAGMISRSREPSEQASGHHERSGRSSSGTQEREDPDPERKRRRLDISDVLE